MCCLCQANKFLVLWQEATAGRCGRSAQSTTRCRISIARCRYQPIVQCILQRAVDNRQLTTHISNYNTLL